MTAWVDLKNASPQQTGETSGWEPPIHRLEQECRAALRTGSPDPWTVAEVRCWLDLVDAEIAAARHRGDESRIGLLGSWRDHLESIEARLNEQRSAA
jgi:hypothetical protein